MCAPSIDSCARSLCLSAGHPDFSDKEVGYMEQTREASRRRERASQHETGVNLSIATKEEPEQTLPPSPQQQHQHRHRRLQRCHHTWVAICSRLLTSEARKVIPVGLVVAGMALATGLVLTRRNLTSLVRPTIN